MQLLSISKLLPDECLQSKLLEQGNLETLQGRCTGMTTGHALTVIGEAMRHQGKLIKFYEGQTEERTKNLKHTISDVLSALNLEHFTLQPDSLTYNINRVVAVTPNGKILTEI